ERVAARLADAVRTLMSAETATTSSGSQNSWVHELRSHVATAGELAVALLQASTLAGGSRSAVLTANGRALPLSAPVSSDTPSLLPTLHGLSRSDSATLTAFATP